MYEVVSESGARSYPKSAKKAFLIVDHCARQYYYLHMTPKPSDLPEAGDAGKNTPSNPRTIENEAMPMPTLGLTGTNVHGFQSQPGEKVGFRCPARV